MQQLDFFVAKKPRVETPSVLLGLTVNLEHFRDRCHQNIARIYEGKGPHLGELKCVSCGRHRGWVSKTTGAWIESVIEQFGRPTAPLIIRERQQ